MELRTVFYGSNPQTAIVIPVRSFEEELTVRCVDNLRQTTSIPFEVILVRSSGKEFTFGRSMNAGIREASKDHDIVIGMDSDAFPDPGAVERILETMRSDDRIGYCGACIRSDSHPPGVAWLPVGPSSLISIAIRARAPLFALRRLLRGRWDALGVQIQNELVPGRMIGCPTTFYATSSEAWSEIGGFDEEYHISYSDVDYSWRIMLSQWYVSCCPSATVYHAVSQTRKAERVPAEWDSLEHHLEKWDRNSVRSVLEASRMGKFKIPNGA